MSAAWLQCGCGRSSQVTHSGISRRELLLGATAAAVVGSAAAAAGQGVIDVHHHIVPPAFMRAHPEYQRLPFLRDWSVAAAIETMDELGIAAALTSLNSPAIDLSEARAARLLARDCNEFAARLMHDHPTRFGTFAAVPALDVQGSLEEIAYAFDVLKVDGVGLMTSYGERYLADSLFLPMFEELNRRKAVVFIHPTVPKQVGKIDPKLPGIFVEMPFDSTRTLLAMLFNGLMSRFAQIRFIFAHGGGALPLLIDRINYTLALDPELQSRFPSGIGPSIRKLYFDTVNVMGGPAFALLKRSYDIEQLLFGTDNPAVRAHVNVGALHRIEASATEKQAIGRDNVLRLIPRLAGTGQGTAVR